MWSYTVALIFATCAINICPLNANDTTCSIQMNTLNSLLKLLNKLVQEKSEENARGSYCMYPLGMESGAILDSQLSGSSEWDNNHGARRGRLNIRTSGSNTGAWSAKLNDAHQWLQVDLGKTKTVTKIALQGRQDSSQWVTSYTVTHSLNGKHWLSYYEFCQGEVFQANRDQNSVVFHSFLPPFKARFVRINPKSWNSHVSMRMELYGCE